MPVVLKYDRERNMYRDINSEYEDKQYNKLATPYSILTRREFNPICEVKVRNDAIYIHWNHYKVNEYTEFIQFIATSVYARKPAGTQVIGQISMIATRNILANRNKYPGIDFSYSQNKFDKLSLDMNLRKLNILRYEADKQPDGLSAVITSFDVLPDYRGHHIGSALLYIATHSIQSNIPIYAEDIAYEPALSLSPLKTLKKPSEFSKLKTSELLSKYGFEPDPVVASDAPIDIKIQTKNRIKFNRAKISSEVVKESNLVIEFSDTLENYVYHLSKEYKEQYTTQATKLSCFM